MHHRAHDQHPRGVCLEWGGAGQTYPPPPELGRRAVASYWNAFLFYTVFATTAANAEESSYACYLDEKRNTYLGDVYSVKWMEDSDQVRN